MFDLLFQKKQKLLNLLLLIFLLVVIYGGFGKLIPSKYSLAQNKFKEKKEEMAVTCSLIANLPSLKKENVNLTEQINILKKPFYQEISNGVNYYYIGQHAKDNNVTITQVLPQPIESNHAILKIPLNIQVRGNYQDILNFLRLIESEMPNTTEILTIKLVPYQEIEGVAELPNENHLENNNEKEINLSGQRSNPNNPLETASKINKLTSIKNPVITGHNPELFGLFQIVTYMVKNPQNLILTLDLNNLGNFDAFNPTIDVSLLLEAKKEPINPNIITEEAVVLENKELDEQDKSIDDLPLGRDTFSGNVQDSTKNNQIESRSSNHPLEKVELRETGTYSFPIRK